MKKHPNLYTDPPRDLHQKAVVAEKEKPSKKKVVKEASYEPYAKDGGFADSAEATDYMFSIGGKMEALPLLQWAQITDDNYGTQTVEKLKKAIAAYNEFLDEMDGAQ